MASAKFEEAAESLRRRGKPRLTVFPHRQSLCRSFSQSRNALDVTHYAERIVCRTQSSFRAGGNDLWASKSPGRVFADFKDFVAKVHSKLPGTEIVFISWAPTPSRWKRADKEETLNRLVEEYTSGDSRLKYVETYNMVLGANGSPRRDLFVADQLHFNAKGYRLLAERVRPFLSKPAAR